MISLRGELVRLRAVEPDDAELLYHWENDTRVWAVSDTLAPFSREIIRKFIENQQHDIFQTRQLRLMILSVSDNRALGMIDIFDFDPVHLRAAVGILICEEADRQKGFASEALDLVIPYSSQILKLHQLYRTVDADNLPSIKLFTRKGFRQTGVRSEWTRSDSGWKDVLFFQKILK